MSIQYICDGCDEPVVEPKEVGHITKRQYCPVCAEKAKAFLDAEEILRKELHKRFTEDRELLIAKFSEGGLKLPDVP